MSDYDYEQLNQEERDVIGIDAAYRFDAARAEIQRLTADLAAANKRIGELEGNTLTAYLTRQWEWSKRTFGPGRRTLGIIQHIQKELREVEAKPTDLSEWVDVAILAMDGYWRHGGSPETFMRDMQAKQDKNFARVWPTPTSEDVAVEHDRSFDAALAPKGEAEHE